MILKKLSAGIAPLVFVGALLFSFPLFDGWYTEAVSFVRVYAGKLAVSAGVLNQDAEVMFGMYKPEFPYSFTELQRLESALGKKIDIISFYTTWGDREEDLFPDALLREIDRVGGIAMLTWEPWTTEFRVNAGRGSDALRTDLAEIAAGRYDEYIREWAREAVIYGEPFFLRFAHEMNNPQYPWSVQAGNTPEDFIRAWRHVWSMFEAEGAENVIWVWSPKREAPRDLYPGGQYVDWIGTGVFNYGPQVDAWYSFEYLFETVYRSVILYDKPIMIAELGCSAVGGSRPAWLSDAWRKLHTQYPATRAVVLYNNPRDRTLPGLEMDWSIDDDDVSLATVSTAVRGGVFRK
jgi:hypothetical protein